MTKKTGIHLEERIIVGSSGTIYKIVPEALSTTRAPEYEIRGALLGMNTDFETLIKAIRSAKNVLIKGQDNAQGNAHTAIKILEGIDEGMINYQLNNRAAIVEFCSLVCIKEGEKLNVHTEEQIRDKYIDWGEIPILDFLDLAGRLIPGFREFYLAAIKGERQQSETSEI